MLLIQFGGLGYMTISTVLAAALGRSVSLQERLTLQEGLNVQGLDGLLRFALTVLKLTLFFELSGAADTRVRWCGRDGRWPRRCGSGCSTRCRRSTTPGSRSGATT